MTAGWCTRTVRAATFAALCVVLAAVGHVTMSGTPVPWWALAAASVTTGPVAWCLAGRERGLVAITSATVVAQAMLHAAFSFAQAVVQPPRGGTASLVERWARYVLCAPPGGAARAGPEATQPSTATDTATAHHLPSTQHGMDHGAGHAMGAMPGEGPVAAAESAGHVGHMGHGEMSSLGMLAAHLLVALICGLWLAYGERAVFRVLRVLRTLARWAAVPLRIPLVAPAPPAVPKIRFPQARSEGAPPRLLVHSVTSRGPPSRSAVI